MIEMKADFPLKGRVIVALPFLFISIVNLQQTLLARCEDKYV
jgi:hypothetical protein